jgi:hypothetical protein
MHYVLIAEHTPDICPTSNAKVREIMVAGSANMPKVAEATGVTILAGPFVSREHISVVVVQAKTGEDLDRFLLESRLAQWNSVRVVPSLLMQEALEEIKSQPIVF